MIAFPVKTNARVAMIDITSAVRDAIAKSTVRNGIALVFAPHTTAAITINENADPDVVSDIVRTVDRVAPRDNAYRHSEGNSQAHIMSSLIGASEQVIIEDGTMALGTWQGIYFCEFDGPRSRTVYVQVAGAPHAV
ncbi:MAG: secondary thiamine-phosphate synthase enzyme YjbQ [Spirochaetota bacterium]